MTKARDLSQTPNASLGFKNRIINGAMTIFQRGTAATADSQYSVDRWRFVKTNDATESTSQNTDAPAGFINSLRNTVSTGDATIGAGQYSGFEQSIEGLNVADLAWGTANASPVTLSFWVRSSVTGQYTGSLRNNDSSRKCPFNYTINAANTWEYKTVSVIGDTTGTWLTNNGIGITVALYSALGSNFLSGSAGVWGGGFGCGTPVNGIASNGNIFAISGVQLEKGTVATSFDYLPYTTKLQLCQRYYQQFNQISGGATSQASGPAQGYQTCTMPVQMRAAPTISYPVSGTTILSGFSFEWRNGAANHTLSAGNNLSIASQNSTVDTLTFVMQSTNIGWSTNLPLIMILGRVYASSEL